MKKCHLVLILLITGLVGAFAGNVAPPVLESFGGSPPPPSQSTSGARLAVSTAFGTSYQVNVNGSGQNIIGDAANEPSLCLDPNNPNRVAIGWRQFNSITNDFRQAGWGWSSNGGVNWTFGGVLETNVFRSDPVLASDANGNFSYLSLQPSPAFHNDLWQSTNGGMSWQKKAEAVGGDKAWLTIDTTTSPGRGNIYQCWSTAANSYSNRIFSRSGDSGATWLDPLPLPQTPYWATLDTGPNGELYQFGWNGNGFWLNRSLNATNAAASPTFDLTTSVNLGGALMFSGGNPVNPGGLLGQPWIAVDKSSGPARGNLYGVCSVSGTGNPVNVMFARSTNAGATWSAPIRINDDSPTQNAWHWFGTLSVAPNGRIDVCWNDTRSNTNNNFSELYYAYSHDGGLSWATNRAISPSFNHTLGYPVQQKMGDYIGMISIEDAACIAYTATFNGEEDIYFIRVEQPIIAAITRTGSGVRLSWNSVAGRTYCVQVKTNLIIPWSAGTTLGCLVATNSVTILEDQSVSTVPQRFYRVVKQP